MQAVLIIGMLCFFSIWAISPETGGAAESPTRLEINVSGFQDGVQSGPGSLQVRICGDYNCHDSKGKGSSPYLHVVNPDLVSQIPLNDYVPQSIVIDGLPPGEYSILVYHDRDDSGDVWGETCYFGKAPADGIVFSGNFSPAREWGRPEWKDTRISLTAGSTHTENLVLGYMCD